MIIRTILSLTLCVGMAAHADAGQPFTPSSNGYDWKSASDSYRGSYCEGLAKYLQADFPGIRPQYLYFRLTWYYDTDDPKILRVKISQVAAEAAVNFQPAQAHQADHASGGTTESSKKPTRFTSL
jgi:hypothetical protein